MFTQVAHFRWQKLLLLVRIIVARKKLFSAVSKNLPTTVYSKNIPLKFSIILHRQKHDLTPLFHCVILCYRYGSVSDQLGPSAVIKFDLI